MHDFKPGSYEVGPVRHHSFRDPPLVVDLVCRRRRKRIQTLGERRPEHGVRQSTGPASRQGLELGPGFTPGSGSRSELGPGPVLGTVVGPLLGHKLGPVLGPVFGPLLRPVLGPNSDPDQSYCCRDIAIFSHYSVFSRTRIQTVGERRSEHVGQYIGVTSGVAPA